MDHATRSTPPSDAAWGAEQPFRLRGTVAGSCLPAMATVLACLLGHGPALSQAVYTDFTLRGGPPFVGGMAGVPDSLVFNGQTTLDGGTLQVDNLLITGATSVSGTVTVGPRTVWPAASNREPALTSQGVFTVQADARLQLASQALFVNAPGATFRMLSDQGVRILSVLPVDLPIFVNSAGARFESAAFTQVHADFRNNGLVTVPAGGALSFWNGGAHHNAAWQGSVQLRGLHGLTGTHTLAGRLEAVGTTTLAAGATLRVAPSSLGAASGIGAASGRFVNAGVVEFLGAPGDLFVSNNGSFLNRGRIQGEVALRLDDGTFSNEAGADVQFAGVGSVGAFVPGAVLRNAGDLQFRQSASITLAGTLDNQSTGVLTVHGQILLPQTSRSIVRNAGALRIASGGRVRADQVELPGGQLQVAGSLVFEEHLRNDAGSSVVVRDAGLLRHTAPGADIGVTNLGAFRIDQGGTVEVGTFVQEAGTLVVDGSLGNLNGGQLIHRGGVLSGTGHINGEAFDVTTGGGSGEAVFRPGSSPGTMTIDGAFHLLPNGILELEVEKDVITGQVSSDLVQARNFFLDGLVRFRVGTLVGQDDVAGLSFLGCSDDCSIQYGDNFVVEFIDRPGSDVAAFGDRLGIGMLTPAPLPEPQAWLLMAAGLAVLGAGLQRRRQASLG